MVSRPGLDAGDDVGVHAVADHAGVSEWPSSAEGGAHHQGVGLADEVGLEAGGPVISAATAPEAGSGPLGRGRSGRGWWR